MWEKARALRAPGPGGKFRGLSTLSTPGLVFSGNFKRNSSNVGARVLKLNVSWDQPEQPPTMANLEACHLGAFSLVKFGRIWGNAWGIWDSLGLPPPSFLSPPEPFWLSELLERPAACLAQAAYCNARTLSGHPVTSLR